MARRSSSSCKPSPPGRPPRRSWIRFASCSTNGRNAPRASGSGTTRVIARTLEPYSHREPLMSVASRLAVPAVLSLTLVTRVCAQEHVPDGVHGERLGRVAFATSCRPDAQPRFERAMALLHSFWWEEGGRAFRDVVAADSTCALAYWGLALNFWGNPFVGGPSGDNLRQGAVAAVRGPAPGRPPAPGDGVLPSPRARDPAHQAPA